MGQLKNLIILTFCPKSWLTTSNLIGCCAIITLCCVFCSIMPGVSTLVPQALIFLEYLIKDDQSIDGKITSSASTGTPRKRGGREILGLYCLLCVHVRICAMQSLYIRTSIVLNCARELSCKVLFDSVQTLQLSVEYYLTSVETEQFFWS